MREPDIRVAYDFRNGLKRYFLGSQERNAGVASWEHCFGSFAAATSALNSFRIFRSSIGLPMLLVKT